MSILSFFLSIILGFWSPKKMGWFVLLTFPLFNAMYAVIVPTEFFPLTWLRFSFAITLGVFYSNFKRDIPVKYILKADIVKLLIVFNVYLLYLEIDGKLVSFFSSHLPGLFTCFVLPFILIKSKSDLHKLTKIFVWQGAIIGFFIVIEIFTQFNPYNFFLVINQSIGDVNFVDEQFVRGGFIRVKGLAGHAVDTGYLLAFYFPLSIWYLSTRTMVSKILFVFILIGSILIQTRATYIAIVISMAVYFIVMHNAGMLNKKIYIKKIATFIFSILFLSFIASHFIPQILEIINVNVISMFTEEKGFGISTKINRLPIALGYIIANPFGYGSPDYIYEVIMNSDDLPAPLIYILSGGVIMGLIYIKILWVLPKTIFNIAKNKIFHGEENEFLILIGCAMVASSVVVLSNWREKHLLVSYILLISVYKIYYLKIKDNPLIKKS